MEHEHSKIRCGHKNPIYFAWVYNYMIHEHFLYNLLSEEKPICSIFQQLMHFFNGYFYFAMEWNNFNQTFKK